MKKTAVFIFLIATLFNSTLSANASAEGFKLAMKKTGGVFSGILISPMVGGFRGFSRGAVIGTKYVAEAMGNRDGSLHRAIGACTGGVAVGCLCGAGGILKGAYEGVEYGIKKPFSRENYAWTGNSLTDYPLGME